MAGLLDFFSGGSDADLYGGLLDEKQRSALATRGLAAMAEKFGQLAMPQRAPIPLGAVLGQGFGAYGAGTDEAVKTAFEAQVKGAQARQLQSQVDFAKQIGPLLGQIPGLLTALGTPSGGTATPGSGSTGGAAVSPSAGGGGGGPGRMSYDQVLQLVLAKGFPADKAPIMAATIMAESGGNPSAANLNPSDPGGSYGLTQINAGAHGPKAKEALGNPDRAVELAYDISKGGTDFSPWSAYKSGAYKQFLPQGGAAPTAAAPAPAGTTPLNVPIGPQGGLLAPNPLSDADPMLPVRPPALGQGALEEQPGFAGRQLVAQLGARSSPLDDVSQYQQVAGPGGGEPRTPLPTMGPTGVELPPMQGPLAVPAPAAAAPAAAAAPGLLSSQFAAPAPTPASSLPQVDPRFGAVAALINQARVASTLAGFKDDPLKALYEGLTSSPAYQAQLELAKRLGVFPLIGPEAAARTTAERGAAEPFNIREETLKADLQRRNAAAAQGYTFDANGNAVQIPEYDTVQAAIEFSKSLGQSQGRLPADLALKTREGEIALATALAKDNKQLVTDAQGNKLIIPLPGGAEADTAAARAKAQAEAEEKSKLTTKTVQVMGADGRTQAKEMSEYDAARQLQAQSTRAPGGTPQQGDIVGTPVFNEFEKGIQSGGVKTFNEQRDAALMAAKNIDWNNESLKLLDSGLYAGWGAPLALQYARIFGIGGKDTIEKVKNTEKFMLERAQQVAAQVRAQPGSASDKDLAFANKVSLGDLSLNEGTVRDMLEIYNKYNRKQVEDFNSDASKIRPDVMGGIPLKVPLPQLNLPDDATRAAAADAIKRGANPGAVRNRLRAQGFDPSGL